MSVDSEAVLRNLRCALIGHDTPFEGPFGERRILYCDFAASGRSVTTIERLIQERALPFYVLMLFFLRSLMCILIFLGQHPYSGFIHRGSDNRLSRGSTRSDTVCTLSISVLVFAPSIVRAVRPPRAATRSCSAARV